MIYPTIITIKENGLYNWQKYKFVIALVYTPRSSASFVEEYGYDDEFEKYAMSLGCFMAGSDLYVPDEEILVFMKLALNKVEV